MKKGALKLTLLPLFLFSVAIYPVLAQKESAEAARPASLNSLAERTILDASIHILVYPKSDRAQHDNEAVDGSAVERARGIGSVITFQGHVLVITHDHWSWLSEELGYVQFLNAQGELVTEMEADAFRSLIRYRDGGTIILEAPGILLSSGSKPASLNVSGIANVDDMVGVAYRSGTHRTLIDGQPMKVESVGEDAGKPILILSSSNGQQIIKGDSGGGVWVNGRLVGNLWKVVKVETTVQERHFWGTKERVRVTDTAVVAQFPLSHQELEQVLMSGSPTTGNEQ